MAMELFVLSDRRLGSIAEWQRAIDAEGFPLRLSDETPFDELDGILPVQVADKQADFECAHWDARELMDEDEYADIDFSQPWAHALSFRWGGNIYSTPAAYMAAAAYAKATGGVMLDCEEGKILAVPRAIEVARDLEKDVPKMEEAFRFVMERIKAEFSGPDRNGGGDPSGRGRP